MGLIKVLGIKLYAYHGCMIEESKIGSDYEVDVVLNSDITLASKSDSLEDTIDYVAVNRIVTEEMAVRSKLLEHVVWRIIHRITECYPEIILLEVSIAKLTPPINGNVDRVVVTDVFKRI